MSPLLHVLIALAAVIALGQLLGALLRRLGQPPVIGEVLAGILLGPSLIGPASSALVLPPASAPYLGVIAQLGVLLYMFVVGLDLHTDRAQARLKATIAISQAGIVVPFVFGAALALWLHPTLAPVGVPLGSFMLFMGVAMSITAFPVLARILTDRDLSHTPLGVVALSCAAAGDVTAWCLLALVVSITKAQAGDGAVVIGGAVVFVAVMLLVVRPFIRSITRDRGTAEPSRSLVAVMFLALLLSAIATEAIGIHAIFGAFLLGALVPPETRVARALVAQLRDPVTILLLPAFFAFTGMRTRIDLVSGVDAWLICGAIVIVATVGKFGGTFAAARLAGYDARFSAALATLMNTRGLMELIVLNVGLELGVISPALFSMMVIMAIVTTMATAPALSWLGVKQWSDPRV